MGNDEVAAVAEEPAGRKPAGRTAPKWETDARQRIRNAVRRFHKPLADLAARSCSSGGFRPRGPAPVIHQASGGQQGRPERNPDPQCSYLGTSTEYPLTVLERCPHYG